VTKKETTYKILYWITLISVASVIGVSGYSFPVKNVDLGLLVLVLTTLLLIPFSQIQLPRIKLHITISDILIFVVLVMYGGEIATFLAIADSVITSISFRRKGIRIKSQTILLNGGIAGITTFITAHSAKLIFGSFTYLTANESYSGLALLLSYLALSQFSLNSIFVTIFTSFKSEETLWKIWFEHCLNGLVMYVFSALIAGIVVEALYQFSAPLVFAALVVLAVVFFTYRRYIKEVTNTSAKAENAERERAELAEKHVAELQKHIAQQETTEKALRESREKFKHAAYHDSLTNLPNRNQFVERIKFLLERHRLDNNRSFTVLSLDLNRFKTINESLGHSSGDKLILKVAERLLNSVRAEDLVARFSGDEFGIILSDISKKEDVIGFIKIITRNFTKAFDIDGKSVFTSVAIGVAICNEKYDKAEDLMRDADIAMYHAKSKEKPFVIFDQTMHQRAVNLLQVETDLRYALERDELVSFYQPIISLETMKVIGFEALMRWNHPKRGLVSPGEFIPVSESTGLIIPMTIWMLRDACQKLAKWQQMSPDNHNLMMSVNLSGKHFAEDNLVSEIKNIINETGVPPMSLKLEITESAVMDNAEAAISMLEQLKRVGVQLSIDDFGTGYSSLSYLHRFPIDTLKIDRSFVSSMEGGSENGEIVRTVIALAKALGLNVIAEGIETIHQLHQLRILGAEYGQGFLFSRPVPLEETEILLADRLRWRNIMPNSDISVLQHKQPDTILQLGDL
jgi:diguanylate cyclase (GGDEF)-like protein